MIAMMRPRESWVGKWNGISKVGEKIEYDDDGEPLERRSLKVFVPGLYAIHVFASDSDGFGGNDNHLDQYESEEEVE